MQKRRVDIGTKRTLAFMTLMIMTMPIVLGTFTVNAQTVLSNRKTSAFLSVNPPLLGLDQELTVNLWIEPAPSGPHFEFGNIHYTDITVTFTRPDGTKDTFKPAEPNGLLAPGESEQTGGLWFPYTPNQVGNWTVQTTYPGQNFTIAGYTQYNEPSTSPIVKFVVQQDPVQIWLPEVPLPTDFWSRPINAENREWYKISGDWLMSGYDSRSSRFNPYSTAPSSAHILWKQQVAPGGIIGGDWGSLSYGGTGASPPIIMMGKIYYNIAGGQFVCVDLRTGQTLWNASGSITMGQIVRPDPPKETTSARIVPNSARQAPVPYLWEFGSSAWKRYDAYSGTLSLNIPRTNITGGSPQWVDDQTAYIVRQSGWNTTIPGRLAINELIRWDLGRSGTSWENKIVWRVSLKNADGTGTGENGRGTSLMISNDATVGLLATVGTDDVYAYNLVDGTRLWTKKLDYIPEYLCSGLNDDWFGFDTITLKIHGYDIKTGNEKWVSEALEYPWASRMYIKGSDYKAIYPFGYDGNVYSINTSTGKINWKFFSGNTTETPFGAWAFFDGAVIADGKVYAATSEHTPTQPRARGNRLFCIDASTGKNIWNISGAIGLPFSMSLAEGYLLGVNEYDGILYCFGKGKTATTVSVQNDVIAKGATVLIKGDVMDQSPAQVGTPAIADESMTTWMEYMHMQNATMINSPPIPRGVQVSLTVTSPDGSTASIGQTTSDNYGNFYYDWTPPSTGIYKIQASFEGSESYWSSNAETAVSVGEAPATTETQQIIVPDYTMTIIAGIIAVIITLAIVGIVLYRKK